MLHIFELFKSKYCIGAFILFFFLSYLIIPKTIFRGAYSLLGIAFMLLFSLIATCILRNVKEKILLAKTYKGSLIAVVGSILGIGSLHACAIGAPICAFPALGIVLSILPATLINLISEYAIYLIAVSLILQLFALHFMGCFRKVGKNLTQKRK